jgi:cytoskeletal protein CcmA (bactofilin family)
MNTAETTLEWSLAGVVNGGSVLPRAAGVRDNLFDESRATYISSGTVLKGVFEFSGRTEINCELEGELVVAGDLIIGPDAEIRANVFADTVTVQGRVYGDIKAETLVSASHGAVIMGNILSPKLDFKEGSYFRGRCWMNEEAVKVRENG